MSSMECSRCGVGRLHHVTSWANWDVAYLLYGSWSLGVVMTAAMTLNLLLAALMGVLIPMTLARLGRDPAMGASVMITAMTESGGFFIFLGLATIFLL